MRLDHLLSKEPLLGCPFLAGWWGSGGLDGVEVLTVPVASSVGGVVGGHVVGFPGFRHRWVCGGFGCVVLSWRAGRLAGCARCAVVVENCIVDASIFCSSCCLVLCGDKLLRAIGGCLGIKSR